MVKTVWAGFHVGVDGALIPAYLGTDGLAIGGLLSVIVWFGGFAEAEGGGGSEEARTNPVVGAGGGGEGFDVTKGVVFDFCTNGVGLTGESSGCNEEIT